MFTPKNKIIIIFAFIILPVLFSCVQHDDCLDYMVKTYLLHGDDVIIHELNEEEINTFLAALDKEEKKPADDIGIGQSLFHYVIIDPEGKETDLSGTFDAIQYGESSYLIDPAGKLSDVIREIGYLYQEDGSFTYSLMDNPEGITSSFKEDRDYLYVLSYAKASDVYMKLNLTEDTEETVGELFVRLTKGRYKINDAVSYHKLIFKYIESYQDTMLFVVERK